MLVGRESELDTSRGGAQGMKLRSALAQLCGVVVCAGLVLAGAVTPAYGEQSVIETFDYSFRPRTVSIASGDTVRWSFVGGPHTSSSRPDDKEFKDQPETWDSGPKDAGQTFERTFVRPGLYQYHCTLHLSFMRGEIQVGTDAVASTLTRLRVRRSGRKVTLTYRLNEPGSVIFRFTGPRKKNVGRKRSEPGAKVVRLGRLLPGRYRGYALTEDDFDNRRFQRLSFRVR
jgi:plastocyanin